MEVLDVKYMLLIYGEPDAAPAPGTAEFDLQHKHWMTYTDELIATGKMVGGDALQATDTATTVRVRAGDRLTTDGPFAETKEVLGGYYVIEADGLDEALDWAARMPNINYGSVEVRPILDFRGDGD
jgi:hypothetical protein